MRKFHRIGVVGGSVHARIEASLFMPNVQFEGNSIFWIEVDKIHPNPYQPRREFDEARLRDLADSIRMYGVLQPLTVTRMEVQKDAGLAVEYELIAGERRLRAAKLAGLAQVPATIKANAEDARMKLELAIIENLQREDLNPIDRAKAFERLAKEFDFTHAEIGKRVGRSREYVSNSIRILMLGEEMLAALGAGKIAEGHTRPLLMLIDRPEEQMTLFKEIMFKRLNVREAEGIARKIAFERARKKEAIIDPEVTELEGKLAESLGTRVQIELRGSKDKGGKIHIDFFSNEDIREILAMLKSSAALPKKHSHMLDRFEAKVTEAASTGSTIPPEVEVPSSPDELQEPEDPDLYSVTNFSL